MWRCGARLTPGCRSAVPFSSRSGRSGLVSKVLVLPDAAHAAGRHLDAAQHQFLLHPHRVVAGMPERMLENGLLDRLRHAVGMPAARWLRRDRIRFGVTVFLPPNGSDGLGICAIAVLCAFVLLEAVKWASTRLAPAL